MVRADARWSGQEPHAVFSWVNRSAAAVPVAAMAAATAVRPLAALPLPRAPTAVSNCCTDDCRAVICG